MVRLRAADDEMTIDLDQVFQFLYGAIKSPASLRRLSKAAGFQFLYGAIKSRFFEALDYLIAIFQFLYGAIKSQQLPRNLPG